MHDASETSDGLVTGKATIPASPATDPLAGDRSDRAERR
jgi:hypothetical protein